MKKYGLHQCRKMLILLILFAVIMSMNAQTTIALEEDTKIKITLPNGYDVLPKLQNDDNDGPYKSWIRLQLGATDKKHLLWVYTLVREMPKEGKELKDEVKNVERTDAYVFHGLRDMTIVRQEHEKWYQWGKDWSKKIYQDSSGAYLATFVSYTSKHMVVVAYDMQDLDDIKEFDTILNSIEYKKGVFGNFYVFVTKHGFLSLMYFILSFFLLWVAVEEWRSGHDKKTLVIMLSCFLALMGWLLFALEGDWVFVGLLILLGGVGLYFGIKNAK